MPKSASPPVHALTQGTEHHFFGYYDKTPWDASGRYVLALATGLYDRPPGAGDAATVGLVDTARGGAWRPVAQTRCWNFQQGNMLQWHPADPERLIVYNARQGGRPVGVVMDAFTGRERVLPMPIYAVSPRGDVALSVNFARLDACRPGYGYYELDGARAAEPSPADDGVFRMDLATGECRLIVALAELAVFERLRTMRDAVHWVNHVQFGADGSRFAFLHRWRGPRVPRGWHTRLMTAGPDGEDLRCLSDYEMVSHYDWRDAGHVLAWARRRDVGDRYFLVPDGPGERSVVGEGVLTCDGHCSYSPDRRWILTDTYPDAAGRRALLLYRPEDGRLIEVGRFASPPELKGEVRCDLHPRWSRDGRRVCFDSAHEGSRQMYVADVAAVVGA
jgi:hypothetical protein